jgi:two-component system response regulator GlrR
LVDDDPSVLKSIGRVLTTEGWEVVTAANGEKALESLAEHQPDLMITDLRMDDISGWDLLFHENMQRPNLPIFVISALPPTAVGGADNLATEFFQKPLDLDVLVTAIRRRLDASRSVQPLC